MKDADLFMETAALKIEYVVLYNKYASEFLPEEYLKFKNLFISNFCTKEDVCLRRFYGYADPLFEISIQNFKGWCDMVGLPELEKMEHGISDAEKIFNYTVTQKFTKMQANA